MNTCSSCGLATLYPDGAIRCDATTSNMNLLDICIKPTDPACPGWQEGKGKIFKAVRQPAPKITRRINK